MGDLRGVTSKLDYIKSLGVDMFWLYSAYKSPDVDNGYDVSDNYAINPEYGTMADFDQLLSEVPKLGLKLRMELVVNQLLPIRIAGPRSRETPRTIHIAITTSGAQANMEALPMTGRRSLVAALGNTIRTRRNTTFITSTNISLT